MMPVATAIQRDGPKINACVLYVRVLCKTRRSFIFLVLAKPRLILDEMCRLYGEFASYLRHVLCKTRLIFPRVNGPNVFLFMACVFMEDPVKEGAYLGNQTTTPTSIYLSPYYAR